MTMRIALTRGFVVLTAARAFADAGGDAAAAFEAVGLPRPDDLAMDQQLPATAYYALVEEMTRRLDDPFFPARAGVMIARSGVPVLVAARNRSQTVGECLLRIIAIFRGSVTNAHYALRSDGGRATLALVRPGLANRSTSRIDTLNAAAFATFLGDEVGAAPLTGLSVGIPDPADLPPDIVARSAVSRRREGGMLLSFPAECLLFPVRGQWRAEPVDLRLPAEEEGRAQGLDFIRERIGAQLQLGPVSLGSVARDVGVSERRLQRMLRMQGVSFRGILAQERLEAARHLLCASRVPICDVAHACGFGSPQALSRAFSAAFRQSPSAYRRRNGPP